jgi:hypothetical protein
MLPTSGPDTPTARIATKDREIGGRTVRADDSLAAASGPELIRQESQPRELGHSNLAIQWRDSPRRLEHRRRFSRPRGSG